MSTFNRAYSAPKGYDMRTPYNIPMGEIQNLRVVKPFGIESIQRNTVVQGFAYSNKPVFYNFPPEKCGPKRSQYIQTAYEPCTQRVCLSLLENQAPWYDDTQLEKLYVQGRPRVK